MGTFQNPVGGPHDPFEKTLRVERIEEDKLTQNRREKEPESPISQETFAIASFLLQMVYRALDSFVRSHRPAKSSSEAVRANLLLLKKSFETLQAEDRSQDAHFLNELSMIWHQVLEDALQFPGSTPVAEGFKALLRTLQNFPENQPHSFGYYLAEYAGQKWIPFPYMELIAKIHTTPETTAPWIHRIQQILDALS